MFIPLQLTHTHLGADTVCDSSVSAEVQIPEDKRESYAKGQHLRGADAQNADRTRAEIVSIHAHCDMITRV